MNCEECKDFFYRPSGVSHYVETACISCDCDLTGSMDGTCIKDETRATNGLVCCQLCQLQSLSSESFVYFSDPEIAFVSLASGVECAAVALKATGTIRCASHALATKPDLLIMPHVKTPACAK